MSPRPKTKATDRPLIPIINKKTVKDEKIFDAAFLVYINGETSTRPRTEHRQIKATNSETAFRKALAMTESRHEFRPCDIARIPRKNIRLSGEAADAWFNQADFRTLESISGLRETDYSPDDGSQDFVDAVHTWWYALPDHKRYSIFQKNS